MPLSDKSVFFQEVLERLQNDVAVLDKNGLYLYVNPSAIADPEMRNWIIGKSDMEYFSYRGLDLEIARQRAGYYDKAKKNLEVVEWEERITDKKGNLRTFVRRLFPVLNKKGSRLEFFIGHGIDITERRKVRDELEANKRFTEAILNTSPQLIYVKDDEGRFLLVNKALADVFNMTMEQFLNLDNHSVYADPEAVNKYLEIDQKVITERKPFRSVEPYVNHEGRVTWFDAIKVPLEMADGNVNVLGISTDITEQKINTDLLRLNERRLSKAEKLTRSGNWTRHLPDDRVEWSEGMYHIWERDRHLGPPSLEEIMGIITTEDQQLIYKKVEEVIAEHEEREFTYNIMLPSGVKTLKTLAIPELDASGKVSAVFGTVMDITEQVKIERNLKWNEKWLHEAQMLSKTGNYEIDLREEKIQYSEACYRLLGWEKVQVSEKLADFIALIHPDDRNSLEEYFKQLSTGNETFYWDGRLITGKGELKHVHTVNSPVVNKSGQITTVFGTIADVTEQKQSEELLRQNEQRLYEAQFMSKMGSYELNLSTSEIKWSKGMYLIWDMDESVKPDLDVFYRYLHPDDMDWIREMEKTVGLNNEPWSLEYRIITPKGNLKYVNVFSKIVDASDGKSKVVVGSCIDITERKLNEERLRLNEQRLLELQELTHTGSWEATLYPEPSMVWSPGAYKIWDLDPDKPVLKPGEYYENIAPGERDNVREAFKKLVKTGEPLEMQIKIITRMNKEKVLYTRGKAIKDETGRVVKIYGTNTDITDSRNTEEKLRLSEQRLLQAQRIAKLGSWHLDLRTHKVEWTEGMYYIWERDLSLPAPDVAEAKASIHEEDLEKLEEAMMLVVTTMKEQAVEFRIILPGGKVKHVEGRGRVERDAGNAPVKIFGTVVDINDRKVVEDELIRARVQAEESAKAKEYFLANISHELRTPLNGIIGMARLLKKSSLSATQREYVDVLYQTAENLMVIINDILDFAKIEAGKLSLEEITFDPTGIADTAVNLQLFKAEEKDISLRHPHTVAAPLPLVLGDPYRLSQILLNLLNNAIKFTNSGEVVLTHRVIEEDKDTVRILFSVKDTGIGIPLNLHQRIFESFTQVDPDNNSKQGGVGLGLTITKSLVERQGGHIWVESNPDGGSEFQFYIPYKKAPRQELSVDKSMEVMDLGTLNILLAEDNKVNLFITEAMLRDWGFNVDIALNGTEAVDLAAKNEYDLILMDIQMPLMNGLEATRTIRQFEDHRKSGIPIIAITANTGKQAHKQFLTEGMNDWVIKPFKEETLYKKIARHIRGKNILSDSMRRRKFPVRKKPLHEQPPLFDLSMLKKDSPENTAFLLRMLTIFIESIPAIVEKMIVHFENSEMDAVSTLAHKIKPTIDSAGINSLKEVIRNIEGYRDKRRGKNQLEDDLKTLKEVIEQVTAGFRAEIDKLKGEGANPGSVS